MAPAARKSVTWNWRHLVGGFEVIRTLSRVVKGVNGSLGWEAIAGLG